MYLGPAMSMNGGKEAGTAIVQMNAFSHSNPFATLGPPANTPSESTDQFGADLSMGAECPFCWPVADAVLLWLTGGEGHALQEPCVCSQNVTRPAVHEMCFELIL